jgi:hypothetical protein
MAWFQCSHKKTSFPVTRALKKKEQNRAATTYVVCLKCGEQIPYSHNTMGRIPERRKNRDAVATA